MPFLPGRPGQAIVPAVVIGKAGDGRCWVTTIDDAIDPLAAPSPPAASADSYRIDAVTPVEHYLHAVRAARDAVRDGRLVKAVIAREVTVTARRPIDRHGILQRLKASFGSSYRFAVGELVGASPELLVQVEGQTVHSYPLAGTAPRAGDPDRDAELAAALMASTKNQVEHRAVIDMVHYTLLPWCSYLDWEPEPGIVRVANVQHLGTRIEGQLSQPAPGVTTLVRALCPTPALGGSPGPDALALIADVERRRGHRGRQRSPRRTGRDPGRVPGHAGGPRPPMTNHGLVGQPTQPRLHRGSPSAPRRWPPDRSSLA